jgi:hypothetical protein
MIKDGLYLAINIKIVLSYSVEIRHKKVLLLSVKIT